MDNFWQQHRGFILKILAGLGVVVVFWIIGSSLTEESLDVIAKRNERKQRAIAGREVPTPAQIDAFRAAARILEDRVRFLAARVGEVRRGESLIEGLIGEILDRVGLGTEAERSRYLGLARSSPKACFVGLQGDAARVLLGRAGSRNVLIADDSLGFGRLKMDPGELPRYLVTLSLVVRAVELAIETGVYEVRSIGIQRPSARSRFEGEGTFLREYPISIVIRGPADRVEEFLARLNDPEAFIPVGELRRLARDRGERAEDVVVAELELVALRVDPEAPLREAR